MSVLPTYIYMGTTCVWYLRKSQERTGSPEIEIIDDCDLPCGC